jgi:Na+-transporting NADH:ubiquinone oxidoreductase subunit C
MALEGDANTVAGLGFYEHAETPGLGGEVDNPNWKAQWTGKQVYKDDAVALRLVKGGAIAQICTASTVSQERH